MHFACLRMNTFQTFDNWINELKSLYGEEEAKAITYVVFEEVLLIKRAHVRLIDKELSLIESMKMEEVLSRLKIGEPLQYILGYTWFCDHIFTVNSAVLIPRPETEELVHDVCRFIMENHLQGSKLLDLCTGSGCIAISLSLELPELGVEGMDVSETAVALAEFNNKKLKGNARFWQGSVLDFDVIERLTHHPAEIWISNPPYLLPQEATSLSPGVLRFEPNLALFTTNNEPLQFYRSITDSFKANPNTLHLFFETSEFYESELKNWLPTTGLNYHLKKDMSGKQRFLWLHK